jgi:hypothetical protein
MWRNHLRALCIVPLWSSGWEKSAEGICLRRATAWCPFWPNWGPGTGRRGREDGRFRTADQLDTWVSGQGGEEEEEERDRGLRRWLKMVGLRERGCSTAAMGKIQVQEL